VSEGEEWRKRLGIAAATIAFGSAPLRAVRDPAALPVLLDRAFRLMRDPGTVRSD
jgi:hypothetical protein